jgi:hypothetical protein
MHGRRFMLTIKAASHEPIAEKGIVSSRYRIKELTSALAVSVQASTGSWHSTC